MRKTTLWAAVVAVVLAFIIAGCGKKEEKKQEAPAQQQTTIVYTPAFPAPIAEAEAAITKPVIKNIGKQRAKGRVYGMRGLFGGAAKFSLGVDEAVAKVEALGFKASAVRPHWQWRQLARTIEANWRLFGQQPIVIIGHSLGADNITLVVEYLRQQGIPVALAVYYDPTIFVGLVPSNVHRAVGYRNAWGGFGQGWINPGPGFAGTLQNRSKVIRHTALDNDTFVHDATNCEAIAVLARATPNCPWRGEQVQ